MNGYESYRALTKGSAVRLAFCWSHVRRGSIDLATKGAWLIAVEVLTHIAALYRIGGEIAEFSAVVRHQARWDPPAVASRRAFRDTRMVGVLEHKLEKMQTCHRATLIAPISDPLPGSKRPVP